MVGPGVRLDIDVDKQVLRLLLVMDDHPLAYIDLTREETTRLISALVEGMGLLNTYDPLTASVILGPHHPN